MTGKYGRLWGKRHWRRGLAVLAALWLGAAAAGEKTAAPAKPDPARQALDAARAQINAAARGTAPAAPAKKSAAAAAKPSPAFAQAAARVAPLLKHKKPETAREAAWLTARALSADGARDAPAARKVCARLRQQDPDGEFGGLAAWLEARMTAASGDAPAAYYIPYRPEFGGGYGNGDE